MVEYLTRAFYFANKEIIDDINWLNTRENYDYKEFSHTINIYYYVYKIEGVHYYSDTPLFHEALEKAQIWEALSV